MTDGTTTPAAKVNAALVRATAHPVGYAILRVLGEHDTASCKEIAAALSKPRSTVGDHLRRFEADGLIECVGEETRRGTVERFYRGTHLSDWTDNEEMGQVSAEDRRRIGLRFVQSVVADASSALSANTLGDRADWCLGSLRMVVDEPGWRELVEIHERALEEVVRVRGESAERLTAEEGEPFRAFSSVMLLELPKLD
jgi:DNA-binding transcriptional ArsR family regulator